MGESSRAEVVQRVENLVKVVAFLIQLYVMMPRDDDDHDGDDDDDIWQEQEQAMDSDRGFTSLSQVLESI